MTNLYDNCSGTLEQKIILFGFFQHFLVYFLKQCLKLYEWQSVYITFFGPTMHWGLFKVPYILPSLTYQLEVTAGLKAYFCQFLVSNVIIFFSQHIFKKVTISLDCVHRADNRCNIWIHWFPSCFFVFLSSLYH